MTEPENFYTSGGTLGRSARSYVTRRADDDLLRHLLNGDFCYVLTSRQMGKSSLMVRTADALRKQGVSVAILDLTRIGQNVSIEQWYDGLLVRLGADLDLEDELDSYWIADRVSRSGPMQRFMGALREVVLPSVKGPIAIFVDEIDAVRSLPFSSDEFFAGIRELYNSRVVEPDFNRLSLCLLGVAQPSDLISNVYITPFNIGHRIELTDFSEVEAQPLVEGLRGKTTNSREAEAILHRILYWTGGHPYLTQKLCETLVQLDKNVTSMDVDHVCGELFLSTRSREQQDNLIFVRDRVLASKEHRAAILDLYGRVLRGEKVRDDDSNATIDPLRLSGLLVVSHGFLKVRNRIYATVFNRKWVAANMPDAELRRQKAAYRRGIALALGISIPVLAVIVLLGIADLNEERKETRGNYFTSAASAQEAFNAGDFETGNRIINAWKPENHEARWLKLLHSWRGREEFEDSFAMRLLESESAGESAATFPRQSVGGGDPTSCDAEMAVATTVFRNRPLIAAAGRDSSVQIWYADTPTPTEFAHLQIFSRKDKSGFGEIGHDPVGDPLKPCGTLDASLLPGIMSLSFSPDGSKLAIATGSWQNAKSKGFVLVWDMNQLGTVSTQVSFKKTADSVAWTRLRDGRLLLAASSEDATAAIWKYSGNAPPDVTNVNPQHIEGADSGSVGGSGAHVVVLSSPTQHLMALGYGDGHLVIYDYLRPDSEKPLYVGVAHVSGIMSMLFLEQKDKPLRLVIGSRDGDLLLISPDELIAAYKEGGDKMASQAARAAMKLTLHLDQGVLQGLTATYNEDHSEAWLLTSGSNGTIGLWAITPNFQLLETLTGHTDAVFSTAFCQTTQDPLSDNGCIVSASADKDVRLWKYPFREHTDSHLAGNGLQFPGQTLGVAFPAGRDGKLLTAVGATTEDKREHSAMVAIWDYKSKTEPRELPGIRERHMVGFDVSPDGKFLVYSSRNRNLVFLDLTMPDAQREPNAVHATLNPKIRVRCLNAAGTDIVPNDQCSARQRDYIVIGVADRADIPKNGYDAAQGLCMWHVIDQGPSAHPRFSLATDIRNPCATPNLSSPADQHETSFTRIARRVGMFDISANGKAIATSVDTGERTYVDLWKTFELLKEGLPDELHSTRKDATHVLGFGEQFANMSFSPDGKYLAATGIGSVPELYFWPVEETAKMSDKDAPAHLGMESLPARGQALAFSNDGRTLAIGLQDARVVLWDTSYRKTILEIRRHHGGILGLAFSPDGDALASSGNDGLVTVMQAGQAKR